MIRFEHFFGSPLILVLKNSKSFVSEARGSETVVSEANQWSTNEH